MNWSAREALTVEVAAVVVAEWAAVATKASSDDAGLER